MPLRVRGAPIRIAAAMRHPDAAAGAHNGLQRRHQPAGWPHALARASSKPVQVRFTIGAQDQSAIAKPGLDQVLQRVFRPHGAVLRKWATSILPTLPLVLGSRKARYSARMQRMTVATNSSFSNS